MKQIRKRLTYANVMSSIAVFLVLGGATAFAASKITAKQLQSNSVTTAKIKKNAVTASKIKNNSITTSKVANGAIIGAKVNLSTLGTVPSATSATTATTATTANALKGRTPFTFFMPAGIRSIVAIGPFTVKANCEINNGSGDDNAELQLYTSVDGASMDDNSGDEFSVFNIGDNPADMLSESETSGEPEIEADEGQLVAVAPNGTTIATENQAVGANIANHPGQCFFAGTVVQLG